MTAPGTPAVIDANVHLVAAADDHARHDSLWASDWPADASLPVDRYLAEMRAAAVSHAVLVSTIGVYGYDNQYATDSAAAHPARLASVGNIDVLAPGAATTLRHWVTEQGMSGARLIGAGNSDSARWLGEPATFAVWREAEALQVPVSAQRTRIATIPLLCQALARSPDVRCVVYSMADPSFGPTDRDELAGLASLARFPHVHLVASPDNLRRIEESGDTAGLQAIVELFGPQRIMWGSYSMFDGARTSGAGTTLADVVAWVRHLFGFLSDEELSWVLGRTAQAVYPRLSAGEDTPDGQVTAGR